jgi:hypothetical protein
MPQQVVDPVKTPVVEANPFYKYSASLNLLQQVSKMTSNPNRVTVTKHLNDAWAECQGTLEGRQMFWSVVMSFGDITNREHNLFRKKKMKNVDQGGNSLRKVFLYCLEWMSKNHSTQFYKFLPILGEYYNLGAMTMFNIVWTDRFKGNAVDSVKITIDKDKLTDYIAQVLSNAHTLDVERKLWAKWLWRIPTSGKRTHNRTVTEKGLISMQKKFGPDVKVGTVVKVSSNKQGFTRAKDKEILECITLLSNKMGWYIKTYEHNQNFVGYKKFRSTWLEETEAHLFSSQKIRAFGENEFIDWIDVQPSGARYNVQRRLFNSVNGKLVSTGKWINHQGIDIAVFYQKWLDDKEIAQKNLRSLTDEEKAQLKKESPDVLKKIEKQAKVNTGAETLLDNVAKLFSGGDAQSLDVVCHSILSKVKIEVPVMVTVDTSSSMSSRSCVHNGISFSACDMARLAATTFMLKNPDPDLTDMFINYESDARVIVKGGNAERGSRNSFMTTNSVKVDWVTDKTKSFLENYRNVCSLLPASGGTTRICAIAEELKRWVEQDPAYRLQRIDQVMKYKVFLVISDGDFNNAGSPAQSLMQFKQHMLQWFGWDGLVVVWDVKAGGIDQGNKFESIPNVIHYGGVNAGILNQIFCNISDYQLIDIYTPLQSIYKSNRYEPVRQLVR